MEPVELKRMVTDIFIEAGLTDVTDTQGPLPSEDAKYSEQAVGKTVMGHDAWPSNKADAIWPPKGVWSLSSDIGDAEMPVEDDYARDTLISLAVKRATSDAQYEYIVNT